MDLQLHQKVVLITGGTSGIGLSSAEFFLREGARVMISGRNVQRGHEARQHLLNTLPDADGHINFVSGDVAVIRDCQHLVSRWRHYGLLIAKGYRIQPDNRVNYSEGSLGIGLQVPRFYP
jgi:NAD(P)-dependent dehydrogenase (short-subunit alcohol dehydrogenase family)